MPIPSNVTSVASCVVHESVLDWPASIVAGFAVNDAVGAAAGAGGGGGGAGATFFLQAVTVSIAARANTTKNHFILR